jgi:hypothetical protein
VEQDWFRRRHHRHKAPSAGFIIDIIATFKGNVMETVALLATLPDTRVDGSALALAAIASVSFLRDIGDGNGPVALAGGTVAGPFASATVNFTDSAPVSGTDTYTFSTTDTQTPPVSSAPSNSVALSITQPPPALAAPSAGTLTATIVAS